MTSALRALMKRNRTKRRFVRGMQMAQRKPWKPLVPSRPIVEPLMRSVDGQLVVFEASVTHVIRVSDLTVDENGFSAAATAVAQVLPPKLGKLPRPWRIGTDWDWVRATEGVVYTVGQGFNWKIYVDPQLADRILTSFESSGGQPRVQDAIMQIIRNTHVGPFE